MSVNATLLGTEKVWADPTAFLKEGSMADFVLMHTTEIKYLCMFVYTFLHGCKLFGSLKAEQSMPYKFVRMIFQCTGGGILVPLFINSIPVSLGNDAYPICIFASFLLHHYFPILRQIVELAPMVKAALVVMYETQRAGVVVKLTSMAAASIPASNFSFPLFGPIFCGSIAGCGGAFLPMDKGLAPLENGLAPNMFSALIAATCYHLFVSTSLSEGIPDAAVKAQVCVAYFFISYGLIKDVGLSKLLSVASSSESKTKKSKKNKKD